MPQCWVPTSAAAATTICTMSVSAQGPLVDRLLRALVACHPLIYQYGQPVSKSDHDYWLWSNIDTSTWPQPVGMLIGGPLSILTLYRLCRRRIVQDQRVINPYSTNCLCLLRTRAVMHLLHNASSTVSFNKVLCTNDVRSVRAVAHRGQIQWAAAPKHRTRPHSQAKGTMMPPAQQTHQVF